MIARMVDRRTGAHGAFFLALLLFIALVLGSTALTVHRLQQEAIRSHLEISATYAHVFEDHLTQTLRFVDVILAETLDGSPAHRRPERLSPLLSRVLRQTPALRSLSLLDAHGRIIASSNPANLGIKPEETGYLPPRMAQEGNYFGIGTLWAGRDFHQGYAKGLDPALDQNELPGFIPVLHQWHRHGQSIRLLAALNPDYLINNFSRKLAAVKGSVDILRYDGAILASTEESPLTVGKDALRPFLSRLPEQETGSLEESLPGGRAAFTSYRASSRYPLFVVTRLDRRHALRQWKEERRLLFLIVIPSLLTVITLATLLYRRQHRIAVERAEERQREHERLAATVFATVDEAVMVTDAGNRIIEVNPAFSAVTGFTPEEVIGQTPEILSSSRQEEDFFARLLSTLAQNGCWQGELWGRHKNGNEYIEWLSIKQVRNPRGEVTHHVAAFSDITDRKRAQEAQLHAVLEASPQAVVMVNTAGRISYANRVSEQVFGYSPRELRDQPVEILVPEAFRRSHENYRAHFSAAPRSRPMASGLKLSVLCKDGHSFPAEISLSPIQMGEERLTIAAVSDISQRIRDEEALRASEQRWKFALEGAGEGVWDWNVVTGQTLFAPRILDCWGNPDARTEGSMEDWMIRIHPDDHARFIAVLEAHLSGHTASFSIEHRVRHRNGHWTWALGRGMVVSHQSDGRPLRMIGTYADISERKAAEEALRQAKEHAESLLDRARLAERRIIDISEETRKKIGQELHDDLGQHLTGVAFLSEVLFQKLKGMAHPESEEAANITRLINDAVAKTRLLAQGLYPVELQESGLQALLAQMARNISTIYRIDCVFTADDDLDIDNFQTAINLFRIAQEALNNAIRHGSARHIHLRLWQDGHALRFEITDDGHGFETGSGDAKMAGLGMHSMRYRASLIGAQLEIRSAPGQGTTLHLSLPIA